MHAERKERIGVVGLGYVGLPLACALARVYEVAGFDTNPQRVEALHRGYDRIQSVPAEVLRRANIAFTSSIDDLRDCTCIIIAVPTPITPSREPDLSFVRQSSEAVGRILQPGTLVIYECTVYPGVTEDICLPLLEQASGLRLGEFDLGYSPERVNPGDPEHGVESIVKVVSGHNRQALERVSTIYRKVIRAGVHETPDIKTAEAAKVIENVQRDLNIALMNELSKIFSLLGISTREVLQAAATKWNFHPYTPGLVGGHCIGVDPYYLTHRALELSYHPEVILAGRRINDNMGHYVGDLTIRALSAAGTLPSKAHVSVYGLTYKENVVDFRNTRATDVVHFLQGHGARVTVWEPMVTADEIKERFGYETMTYQQAAHLDAVVLVNRHDAFQAIRLPELKAKMRTPVLIDLKGFFDRADAQREGFRYVSL